MNILVTGANGQLGTELRLASTLSSHRFIFTDVSSIPAVETVFLDITNIDAIRIVAESEDVDVIINCAAYTDVNKAESDISFADLLNHTAAQNLATVAAERGAALIHISTDYVFDGEANVPYRENDRPSPLGAYGITKYTGERSVINSGCRYIIIRTAWLYSPFGRNFVKTMAALTQERPEVSVVFDQVGSPTYAGDLAALIMDIIERNMLDRTGIYHYTNEGVISWYDLTVAINDLLGHGCHIKPCRTEDYPTPARRPHYSVLDKSKVRETFGVEIPYWYDSLVKCLKKMNLL